MARFLALIVATGLFLVPVTGTTAHATPDNFTPRPGPTFNNPEGGTQKARAILNRVLRTVNSTPRGAEVKFFTWNFLTKDATDTLLRAERRGVTVRVLIDERNTTALDNGPFRRLRNGLRRGNQQRFPSQEPSWARTCRASCRGTGGAAHAKFFMFSRAGRTSRVVMQGSANLTLASANNQWNDVFTHSRNLGVWNFYDRVFTEASRDRRAPRPFASQRFGGFRLMMFPLAGRPDPVMQLLNQVRCRRATNTGTGRTRIRIAPDVIRQSRGLRLARKVRGLWDDGCDIKIGYTIVGKDVGQVLRAPRGRGPVPMRHLVRDPDGDRQFDKYFHMKAMSVVGNVAGDRSNHVLLNGSANWSGLAGASDENVGIYWDRNRTLRYQEHIDYWYGRFPASGRPAQRSARMTTTDVDRTGMLVFGTGRHAVYEDGTPYSTTGLDPYAELQTD